MNIIIHEVTVSTGFATQQTHFYVKLRWATLSIHCLIEELIDEAQVVYSRQRWLQKPVA